MPINDVNTHVQATFTGEAASPENVWRLIDDFRASMVVWQCDVLQYTNSTEPVRTMTFGEFPPTSEKRVVSNAATKTMQYDGADAANAGYQSQMQVRAADGGCMIDWQAHSLGGPKGIQQSISFYNAASNHIAAYFGARVQFVVVKPELTLAGPGLATQAPPAG